jgi:hypothetical protein
MPRRPQARRPHVDVVVVESPRGGAKAHSGDHDGGRARVLRSKHRLTLSPAIAIASRHDDPDTSVEGPRVGKEPVTRVQDANRRSASIREAKHEALIVPLIVVAEIVLIGVEVHVVTLRREPDPRSPASADLPRLVAGGLFEDELRLVRAVAWAAIEGTSAAVVDRATHADAAPGRARVRYASVGAVVATAAGRPM